MDHSTVILKTSHIREVVRQRTTHVSILILSLTILCLFIASEPLCAASHWETEKLFFSGDYHRCEEIASQEVDRGVWNEQWPYLLIECLMVQGRYAEAATVFENSLERYSNRIALRMKGYEIYRMLGQPEQSKDNLEEVYRLVSQSPWRYSSSRDQVTLGRFFALQGEDAREILDLIYDRVRKRNERYTDVYIATAELALEKHDYKLAAENLETAAKLEEDNPYIFYLQARAWLPSDDERGNQALGRALSINPNHIPSLLLQVDYLIDAERYAEAESILEQVLAINPFHPEAWAYHAVIAHLEGHYKGESALRSVALSNWKTNHQIDHLIGRKLSQKYRFAEGAAYQRRSLVLKNDFTPARFQLAQDLLRLGDEKEGWNLAKEVQAQDGYNVVAFNLMALKDELDRYRTITEDGFIVRMEAREAAIYGQDVIQLLRRARDALDTKYDISPEGAPVIVEIFPRQQDFAIRTFGLPGGAGYLGVCFGRVITANSPASQGSSPANWQSVLWHEYCHVVTLSKTNNRMPRWLSEGISVYEERLANPAWGQRMTPQYRQMILGGLLTPVSQLSSAFLRPPSPLHLQFAYYESSLVVEYLVEQHGLDILRRVLVDLGAGVPINEALQRYIGPPTTIDKLFEEYAKERARELATELSFDDSVVPEQPDPASLATMLTEHPNNYFLLKEQANSLISEEEWELAKEPLETIHQAYPNDTTAGNAAGLLAQVHRELGDTANEEEYLSKLAEIDDDAIPVYTRLIELSEARQNWEAMAQNAERLLAVNPMLILGQEKLGQAAKQLEDHERQIAAQRALLEMNPADPAAAHYELAVALTRHGETEQAKRHVLMALEEAPRYRNAQRLLLRLITDRPDVEEER